MAIIDCHYQCGCGFDTADPIKALDHAVQKRHTITITGSIKPGTLENAKTVDVKMPKRGDIKSDTVSVDTESYSKLRQMILAGQRSQK